MCQPTLLFGQVFICWARFRGGIIAVLVSFQRAPCAVAVFGCSALCYQRSCFCFDIPLFLWYDTPNFHHVSIQVSFFLFLLFLLRVLGFLLLIFILVLRLGLLRGLSFGRRGRWPARAPHSPTPQHSYEYGATHTAVAAIRPAGIRRRPGDARARTRDPLRPCRHSGSPPRSDPHRSPT